MERKPDCANQVFQRPDLVNGMIALDIWGYDMPHDWPTWRAMLPHYLATRFLIPGRRGTPAMRP
jgi:esterase/lipase superfamily enzyme